MFALSNTLPRPQLAQPPSWLNDVKQRAHINGNCINNINNPLLTEQLEPNVMDEINVQWLL